MVKLSETTAIIVEKLFPPEQRDEVRRLLEEECGNNLPFCENSDAHALERIRSAVLKISEGDISQLRQAIKLAKLDWRDVLMGAGFGRSVTAHKEWERDFTGAI